MEKNECSCTANIDAKDPRAKTWIKILGNRDIPLKHPIPHYDSSKIRFLQGDLSKLTPEQQNIMYSELARKFKVKKALIKADFEKRGFIPVKDENIIVFWCEFHVRLVT